MRDLGLGCNFLNFFSEERYSWRLLHGIRSEDCLEPRAGTCASIQVLVVLIIFSARSKPFSIIAVENTIRETSGRY